MSHTGRPLIAPRSIAIAYLLVSIAAAIRVVAPLLPMQYNLLIALAGSLWTAAFAIFVWVYAPILIFPRYDGKPG